MENFKAGLAGIWREKWEFLFCLAILNAIIYGAFQTLR